MCSTQIMNISILLFLSKQQTKQTLFYLIFFTEYHAAIKKVEADLTKR